MQARVHHVEVEARTLIAFIACVSCVGKDSKREVPRSIEAFDDGSVTNYFTSSDPHHDMLGGGCQVRVVIENMIGRMENLRTLISGFLGIVILI